MTEAQAYLIVATLVVLAVGVVAAWLVRRGKLPNIPIWLVGMLGTAVAGLFVYTILDLEIRTEDKKRAATPGLIAECHAKGGTAQVEGPRSVYTACLIPPPGK